MKGMCCVVTGGTGGLGLATIRRLKTQGAEVVFSCRTQQKADATMALLRQEDIQVDGIAADAGSESQKLVSFALEKMRKIDVLICNAAVRSSKLAIESNIEELRRTFEVNVFGVFQLCQAALPYLKQSSSPAIVVVSSLSAFVGPLGSGLHSVSKAALLGLVKVLALELIPYNIRVNGIAPGLFPNDHLSLSPQERTLYLKRSEKGRPGAFEDAAGVICYLASREASYVMGETVSVAGVEGLRL